MRSRAENLPRDFWASTRAAPPPAIAFSPALRRRCTLAAARRGANTILVMSDSIGVLVSCVGDGEHRRAAALVSEAHGRRSERAPRGLGTAGIEDLAAGQPHVARVGVEAEAEQLEPGFLARPKARLRLGVGRRRVAVLAGRRVGVDLE